jgi:hypothetical protein
MIFALLSVFAGVVKLIVSLLPVGPTLPASVGQLFSNAVGFLKGIDYLVDSSTALACIVTITLYEIGMAAFRSIAWAYTKVRSG